MGGNPLLLIMPTNWSNPSIVSQYAEHPIHIAWDLDNNLNGLQSADANSLKTVKDLLFISNPTANNIRMKTWFLSASGYNFENIPTQISGIEVMLGMKRGGRITDDTVQLQYNGGLIGDNKATFDLDMIKTYGGSLDLWEVGSISPVILGDPTFGVVVRFQSHPQWPHRETPLIDYLKMRIW
jgi:hypothetical protein